MTKKSDPGLLIPAKDLKRIHKKAERAFLIRQAVVEANKDLHELISEFNDYTGSDGRPSTAPEHGFSVVHKMINAPLGLNNPLFRLDDLPTDALRALLVMLTAAANVLIDGMEDELPRKTIKRNLKDEMTTLARSFKARANRKALNDGR